MSYLRPCSECKTPKNRTEFYITKVRKRGRTYEIPRARCKACHNRNERTRKSRRVQERLNVYRRRSRALGEECDLTREDMACLLRSPCAYCGRTTDDPEVDRADSHVGYIKSNVKPACRICNRVKSDMPVSAWEIISPAVSEAIRQGKLDGWRSQT